MSKQRGDGVVGVVGVRKEWVCNSNDSLFEDGNDKSHPSV
jgi:hypothetical protein